MAYSSSVDGPDYNFLDEPPEELKCLICFEVARDPLQHEECGKLFCKECIERYGKFRPCPNCREGNSQYYVDKRSRRNVQDLRVKCGNKKCRWRGTVGTLEYHSTKCWFTLLSCPNECKDDNGQTKYIIRKSMDDHLKEDCPNRDYRCEHCGEEDTYTEITEVHDRICEEKIIPCPNGECRAIMPRREVDDHVKSQCEYTVISCKYESIGCAVRIKRKEMEGHEQRNKQQHLDMAMDTTLQLKKELMMIKEKEHTLNYGNSMTLKFTGFQTKKEENEVFDFPPFYTHPCGYSITLQVHSNGYGDGKGEHLSIFIPIMNGKYDNELTWPFIGHVNVTLLNQMGDWNHYTRTIHFNEEKNAGAGDCWGTSEFMSHYKLSFSSIDFHTGLTQYLVDDTLYFRVSVNVANYKPWLHDN